jgi:hypothetical protein
METNLENPVTVTTQNTQPKPLYPNDTLGELSDQIVEAIQYSLRVFDLPKETQNTIIELIDKNAMLNIAIAGGLSQVSNQEQGELVPATYWALNALDNQCRDHIGGLTPEEYAKLSG